MGIPSGVPAPPHIIRVSPTAWAVALEGASAAEAPSGAHQPPATSGLTEPESAEREEAWAELERLGVATGNHLSPVWRTALKNVPAPAILLRLAAAYNGVGANSDFTLSGHQGVCVHRRCAIENDDDGGLRTTAHAPSLEVALFDTEHLWGAISRVLPPLTELRTDAAHARPAVGDNVLQMPLTPPEVAAVVPEEAILSAAMTTRAGEARQVWAGRWSVSRGTLYSVRTTDGALLLTPQRPGHVAREVTFAIAGAYEFLSGAAASA